MSFNSYITKDFYRDTYPSVNKFQAGEAPTTDEDTELDTAIFEASLIIDILTLGRSKDYDNLFEDCQEAIQYATAAQVDYLTELGYDPQMESNKDYGGGFKLGRWGKNDSASSSKAQDMRKQDSISPKAKNYLRTCGLTKRTAKHNEYTSRYTFGRESDNGTS